MRQTRPRATPIRPLLVIFVSLCNFAVGVPASSEVLTWECDFSYRTDDDGRTAEAMTLLFKVDTFSRKAYMEGNAGIVEVDYWIGDSAFSFMEKAGSGSVQTTTVMPSGEVVHSRNTVLLGQIVAAQHFGRCRFE